MRAAARSWTLLGFIRATAAWAFTTAAVFGLIGFAVDGGVVLFSGHSARLAIATGMTAAAFGALSALSVAPLFVVTAGLCHVLDARARFLWLLAIGIIAYLLTAIVAVNGVPQGAVTLPAPPNFHFYAVRAGFVLGILAAAVAVRLFRAPLRTLIGVAIVAFTHYELLGQVHHALRDVRDLLALLGIAGGFAVLAPLRRHFAALPTRRLAALSAVAIAVPLAIVHGVDRAAPGWRAVAWQYAVYQPRLARLARAVLDIDYDGYSSVAWGTDCADLDRRRHPVAPESRPGVDMNCNGVTLPEHPTDADRGLTPPFGDPDADNGDGVPLVVVVTIDCLRYDAFRPDVMPHLTAFAERGVLFRRLYSAGTRTITSMRLMDRGSNRAPTVAAQLGAVGIDSTAIFPLAGEGLDSALFAGFTTRLFSEDRWNAAKTTELALAAVRASAQKGAPHLLWVHYIDAHLPYVLPPAGFPHEARFGASFGSYLAELAFIDRELSRLLDAVSADPARRITVLVTADHGEGFGMHNIKYHGVSGYQQLVHVPGIIVAPGMAPGRYDEIVSHRDLPSTILGSFGRVSRAPEIEKFGRSWLRLRSSPSAPLHRFAVTHSARAMRGTADLMPMAVIVERDLKLIETFEDGLLEMYAPDEDPSEVADLADSRPEERVRLRHELAIFEDIDHAVPVVDAQER